MRIAAISDIHGNLTALEAVLGDVSKRQVDQIVNLGDILSGALFPRETADLLMPLGIPTIKGNHERQVLTFERERMSLSDRHAADNLRDDQFEWLESLPESLRLFDDVLAVHGTPGSDIAYFLETVTRKGLRQATREEVQARAMDADAALILCGHTHIPRIVRLDDGRLIVNPGSVGLPAYEDDQPFAHVVENGTPHARYAIVEKRDELWSAELLAVEYDWHGAAEVAERNGRPDWARALATGRV